MKTIPERFEYIKQNFPQAHAVLLKLEAGGVPYLLGGSASLYIQGNPRPPHDLDLMFLPEAHRRADALFNIEATDIVRPNVTMHKSSPLTDGSLDFLSEYTVIADGRSYHSAPNEHLSLEIDGRIINLVPAEKIAVFKLIGRRSHHQDEADAQALLANPHFNQALFWQIVDQLSARPLVEQLLSA